MKPSTSYLVSGAAALHLLQGAGATAAPQRRIEVVASAKASPAIGDVSPSTNGARLLKWIIDSGDNLGLPFIIIDKIQADVIAFHPDGSRSGSAAALIGLARGDVSPPGIGQRRLADILPSQRITPAGRFIASLGHDFGGPDVLWVDYDAGISLHRVITGNPKDKRRQRLRTPTTDDNRITYGCINVPPEFFDRVIGPLFTGTNGVVYILPDTRPLTQVFDLSINLVAAPVARSKPDPSQPQLR